MQMSPELQEATALSAQSLITNFNPDLGFPFRASSHSDLWVGDRWSEAYIAIDEVEMAKRALQTAYSSVRPDGSVPHLMQGSHKRAGIETRFIDRSFYRISGIGAKKLPNGNYVTKLYAPLTLALGTEAVVDALDRRGDDTEAESIVQNTLVAMYSAARILSKARGSRDGTIRPAHRDELTINGGTAADKLVKASTPTNEPDLAINALFVLNNEALLRLARSVGKKSSEVSAITSRAKKELTNRLKSGTSQPEATLAKARLGYTEMIKPFELLTLFTEKLPESTEKPEAGLSMAELIEITRLTSDYQASRDYLQRVSSKIAKSGIVPRFEDILPDSNPVANKSKRAQIWTPTAAEIVQIPLAA